MIILFPILLNGEDTEANNFDYGCASFRFVERDNYSFKTSDNIAAFGTKSCMIFCLL